MYRFYSNGYLRNDKRHTQTPIRHKRKKHCSSKVRVTFCEVLLLGVTVLRCKNKYKILRSAVTETNSNKAQKIKRNSQNAVDGFTAQLMAMPKKGILIPEKN